MVDDSPELNFNFSLKNFDPTYMGGEHLFCSPLEDKRPDKSELEMNWKDSAPVKRPSRLSWNNVQIPNSPPPRPPPSCIDNHEHYNPTWHCMQILFLK